MSHTTPSVRIWRTVQVFPVAFSLLVLAASMDPLPSIQDYDLQAPVAIVELPDELEEVSGLAPWDDSRILAIQDEKAHVYAVNLSDGRIEQEWDFGKNRDYEGIERVGDTVYVLESDGTLYRIPALPPGEEHVDSEKLDSPLGSDYDTEGLAYDKANHRLLILCKEDPGKELPDGRAIFAYDLQADAWQTEPLALLPIAPFEVFGDADHFKPSALGVHPHTGQVYLVSSVLHVLVELSPSFEIWAISPLPSGYLPQPEGLMFMGNGDLLLASEAAGGTAHLVRYRYNP